MPCTNTRCSFTPCALKKYVMCPKAMVLMLILGIVLMIPKDANDTCSVCCVYKMIIKTSCGFLDLIIHIIELPLYLICGTKTKLNNVLQFVVQMCCQTPCCGGTGTGAVKEQAATAESSPIQKRVSIKDETVEVPTTKIVEEPPTVYMVEEKTKGDPVPKARVSIVEIKRASIEPEIERSPEPVQAPVPYKSKSVIKEKSTSIIEPAQKSVSLMEPKEKSASIPEAIKKSSSIIEPTKKSTSMIEQLSRISSIIEQKEKSASLIEPREKSESLIEPKEKSESIIIIEPEPTEIKLESDSLIITEERPEFEELKELKKSEEEPVKSEPKFETAEKVKEPSEKVKEPKEESKLLPEGVCKKYHSTKCLKCRCAKRKEARVRRSFEQSRYRTSEKRGEKKGKNDSTITDVEELLDIHTECCRNKTVSSCVGTERCCRFKEKKRSSADSKRSSKFKSLSKSTRGSKAGGSAQQSSYERKSIDSKRQSDFGRKSADSKRFSNDKQQYSKTSVQSKRSSAHGDVNLGSIPPSVSPSANSLHPSTDGRTSLVYKHSSTLKEVLDTIRASKTSDIKPPSAEFDQPSPDGRTSPPSKGSSNERRSVVSKRSQVSGVDRESKINGSQTQWSEEKITQAPESGGKIESAKVESPCPGDSKCSLESDADLVDDSTQTDNIIEKPKVEKPKPLPIVVPEPRTCACNRKDLCRDTCRGIILQDRAIP